MLDNLYEKLAKALIHEFKKAGIQYVEYDQNIINFLHEGHMITIEISAEKYKPPKLKPDTKKMGGKKSSFQKDKKSWEQKLKKNG